jgi:hypothetical protein
LPRHVVITDLAAGLQNYLAFFVQRVSDIFAITLVLSRMLSASQFFGRLLHLLLGFAGVHHSAPLAESYLTPMLQKIDIEARTRAKEAARAKQRLAKLTVKMFRVETAPGVMHAPVSRENICAKMYLQHRVELQPSQLDLPSPLATYAVFVIRRERFPTH